MFAPYEHISIESELTAKEIHSILECHIDSDYDKDYVGSLSENDFKVRRVIGYRNGMLPVITGLILPSSQGTTVNITMKPNLPAIISTVLFLSLLLLIAIMSYTNLQGDLLDKSMGFIMFVLAYAFMTALFKFESIKSKAFFRQIFNTNL